MPDDPRSGPPSGEYAGPLSRLAAYAVDALVSTVALAVLVIGVIVTIDLVTGAQVRLRVASEIGAPATTVWLFLYFFMSWASTGRTPGMAVLGLRVARRDGGRVSPGQAALRTLAFRLSFIGGLAFVGIVVGRAGAVAGLVTVDSIAERMRDRPSETAT